MRLMIAIIDTVSNEIVQNAISLHRREETALRMWDDVMRADRNTVNMHIADHQLVQLGVIDDENLTIVYEPEYRKIIITGEQWLALQPKPEQGN